MSKDSIERTFIRQVTGLIDEYGKPIEIQFHSSYNCSYCTVNPITHESLNPYCTTCNGTGKYTVSTSYYINGIVNNFIGNPNFILYGNETYNLIPEGRARVTCWLNDVLVDDHSTGGKTYLDSADAVVIYNNTYTVKNYQRTGINKARVAVINLELKEGD